jgi:hypothetical protein
VLVPEPVLVISPGLPERVQVPDAGRPDKTTLPVDTSHVGWVTVPGTGAPGIAFTVKV